MENHRTFPIFKSIFFSNIDNLFQMKVLTLTLVLLLAFNAFAFIDLVNAGKHAIKYVTGGSD